MEPIAMNGLELGKRKRSPSLSSAAFVGAPAAKTSKTTSAGNSLSINYLARQTPEDLPLLNKDDTLPNLLNLIAAYSSVLDRHESLASNLGARPLGPILIKRFERCFDAPPKIVATHQKTTNGGGGQQEDHSLSITWLEVIEFARSHPAQFTLGTFSEGRKVCQFYYPQKQLRVQISEEDFLFINSGRCQELIPPLPIWEDEEKEVGACDVLDGKLRELTNVADMVAARTRQLSHRLKGRRAAIVERRAEGGSGTPAKASMQQTTTAPPLSAFGPGFNAVNNQDQHVRPAMAEEPVDAGPNAFNAVRSELLRHFESLPHNQNVGWSQSRQSSNGVYHEISTPVQQFDNLAADASTHIPVSTASSLSPNPPNVAAMDHTAFYSSENGRQAASNGVTSSNNRPSSSANAPAGQVHSKHNFSRPLNPALESSQPFRPFCQAHMDGLPRGHRVLPPCDRCRRLRMDCVKNLTSCAGCTKKHARCHWKEVTRDELGALDHLLETAYSDTGEDADSANGNGNGRQGESDDDDSNPLEDLMALGANEHRQSQDQGPSSMEEIVGGRDARDQLITHAGMDTLDAVSAGVVPKKAVMHELQAEDDSIKVASIRREVVKSAPTPQIIGTPTNRSSEMRILSDTTNHGGFRPVNNISNGQEMSTGWRDSS